MGTVEVYKFDAGYLPRHVDDPIVPSSGKDLAAIIDEMYSSTNEECSLLSIAVRNSEGIYVVQMDIGVRAAEPLGCLRYIAAEGDVYSKGKYLSNEPVAYYDFGNERLFAPGSQIPLDAVKAAVIQLFDSNGGKPDCVEWQEWHGWILDDDDDDDKYLNSESQAPSPDYSDPPF
ncbi:Imm1 family immunity protein [Nocardia sp. NBC_01503]|uniref:Imm1 family immunity protein n=1 Tax=Nocardia sp. NBC_01503 TaxID=2975997 RepID=UPI002E7B9C51|nr:Imm1 family immunity protein [Nocardia sp. NBC_01503]WTL35766.1 Imm1 family immunity protein [Nocardia sp. NBC_01503]